MSKGKIPSQTGGGKNSKTNKKATKHSKAGLFDPATTEPGHVTIRIGTRLVSLPLDTLGPAAIQDLAEQVDKGKLKAASVELGLSDVASLTPKARGPFCDLVRAVSESGHRPVTLRVGGETYAHLTDWLASTLADPTADPAEKCRALGLTAGMLAHAYPPADRDVHLDAVAAKLRDRGFTRSHCDDAERNVRLRLREHGPPSGAARPHPAGAGGLRTGAAAPE